MEEAHMTNLIRWDTSRDLSRLQGEWNRLFVGPNLGTASPGWAPSVDVFEDAEGLTFKFELPEVEAKDVQVKLEDGDKRDNYHRIERAYGAFARSFTLPATFDAEKVSAEAKHGVLRIYVPK